MTSLTRPLALAALLAFAAAGVAQAEDAPIDLHANPAKPAKDAKPTKPAKPAKNPKDAEAPKPAAESDSAPADAARAPLAPAEAIARANAFLDGARVLSADFVQIGPDGRRTEGKLSATRPGRMLFQYSPPAHLEIVADGRSVAVRDTKLNTQDLYLIAQTPLKFLLADHIDLAKDTRVLKVTSDDKAVTIELEDKATFGGTAHIALVFDPATFELKQWTVIDAQGFQTLVTLFNLDLVSKPDPALFHIDELLTTSDSHTGKK